jgi:DNA-3-methyladenine glycosylase II
MGHTRTNGTYNNVLQSARLHLRKDPIMARLIREYPDFNPRAWLAELPPMDAFGALVFQVAGQQLSIKATRKILERLQAHFGGKMPTPRQVLGLEPTQLRNVGFSARKVTTLRVLAQRFAEGSLSQGQLEKLSDQEVMERLTAIPGVGPWTAQGVLIIALGRMDVVLPGDLALRKAIKEAYALDRLPTQDEVITLAEAWRPYRSVATAYLFQSTFGEK